MQGNSANSSNATDLIEPWVGLCPARHHVFSRGCHTSFSQAAKKKKLSTTDPHMNNQRKRQKNKLTNLPPGTIYDYKNWFSGSSTAQWTKNDVIPKIKTFFVWNNDAASLWRKSHIANNKHPTSRHPDRDDC
jgi:hypothetical protein